MTGEDARCDDELVSAYLDDELGSEDALRVRAALDSDPELARVAADYGALSARLADVPKPPDELWSDVRREVEREELRWRPPASRRLELRRVAGVAAAAVLISLLVLPLLFMSGASTTVSTTKPPPLRITVPSVGSVELVRLPAVTEVPARPSVVDAVTNRGLPPRTSPLPNTLLVSATTRPPAVP